jgi:LysM repeat protein
MMRKWYQSGLSQPDMIHLSINGYKLKGDLMADAFMNTVNFIKKYPFSDSMVVSTSAIKEVQKELLVNQTPEPSLVQNTSKGAITYVIRPGDTLSHISMKYGVSVSEIQNWNNLRSTLIIAGRTLTIYPRR